MFALQPSDDRWCLIRRTVSFQVILQFPEPMPLRCPFNLMVEKLVHDNNVVDQIQDQLESFQTSPYTLLKTLVVENPVLVHQSSRAVLS